MRASSPWTLSSPLLFLLSWPTRDQSESNHMAQFQDQSRSPIAWTNARVLPFQILLRCARRQVTSPLAEVWTSSSSTSLSVGHHPTRSRRRGCMVTQAALRVPAHACRHAMTADHACRHRTQVNLLVPDATYNRVSVSLCL